MEDFDFNITIVGLGLMGGCYASSLKKLNPRNIYAVDIDKEALKLGKKRGIIDKGFTSPEIPLKESDLVIICLYPNRVKEFIKDNIKYFKSGTIITDVTGIKTNFIEEINELLRDDIDFVFGHPMAGREFSGVKYSSKEVFQNANYIITPNKRNKVQSISIIEDIVKKIGFSSVKKISPELHDRVIGFTSQLPHVIAVSLVNSDNLGLDIGKFTGDSYRDLTRIARINTRLWTELFIGNKENLVSEIEGFQENIQELKLAIVNEDIKELNNILNKACKKREGMS
ncbi:prephenate dehydrogenase [Clostridium botulinum]|uniref:Prephenate dehydrogenase n=1 Tax=Clostridium botulinum C/D str. DC5 TaxID=1443128 RepID=A0A0A0IAP8_CLOBO|nr:prephenate dehydrogenase [Clostridium botulinum]KEI02389.1 prephenate dehydrogenase [Clostridium botulinum C/D str. BKT75002]KEI08263.1 prephenate dehydrogenase [Clostridium botulinum C/D str. BKT2873]KGM93639.1 prephenate dehydrogenase [Clostridium botulinum D str. CCUG 7971]KGM98529.1 prephenate dehydrogenase [Clostridium botulinum C/D str. DC5]KOC47840.1 prephenate dehydrogenase [Clostridium botulinum]